MPSENFNPLLQNFYVTFYYLNNIYDLHIPFNKNNNIVGLNIRHHGQEGEKHKNILY